MSRGNYLLLATLLSSTIFANPKNRDDVPVLRGVLAVGASSFFCLSEPETEEASWLQIGDKIGEFTLTDYNFDSGVLTVQRGESEFKLHLAESKIKDLGESQLPPLSRENALSYYETLVATFNEQAAEFPSYNSPPPSASPEDFDFEPNVLARLERSRKGTLDRGQLWFVTKDQVSGLPVVTSIHPYKFDEVPTQLSENLTAADKERIAAEIDSARLQLAHARGTHTRRISQPGS